MREKSKKQLPLMYQTPDHPQARELEAISRILDSEPTITKLVHQGLCRAQNPRLVLHEVLCCAVPLQKSAVGVKDCSG